MNDRPPNVLLILTDDPGWGDIRSHGNDKIDTPVLDGLAGEGARFERFFVSPVCAPTRAGLLTGRYHPRTGVHGVTRAYETMREEEVTLAEALKQAGYATGCFGKWHNGAHYPRNPNGQGFDEFLGFCAGHWNNYFDTMLEHNGKPEDPRLHHGRAHRRRDLVHRAERRETVLLQGRPTRVDDGRLTSVKRRGACS